MTEVMAMGTDPAARPEFASVARHMFRAYDDEGAAYCTACHRVMAGDREHLERHYAAACARPEPKAEPDGARRGAYACGPCGATMDDGAQWTRHMGSRGHWRRYAAAARSEPSHAHRCERCAETCYRPAEHIRRHMFGRHDAGYTATGWQRAADAVFRARSSYYAGAMHCCAACGAVRAERPVHDPLRPACGPDPVEAFYCRACRLTFVGDADAYRTHAASPEHVAIAENEPLWRRGPGDAADRRRWTVPAIVWRLFGGYPDGRDRGTRACGLCGDRVPGAAVDERAVLAHLDACALRPAAAAEPLLRTPPAGKSAADYDAFRCGVCCGPEAADPKDPDATAMTDAAAWSRHMTRHLLTPRAFAAYAYAECSGCRTLYFGPRRGADDGTPCSTGGAHRFRPLPVADAMRYVYRETNADADRRDDDGDDDDGDYDGHHDGVYDHDDDGYGHAHFYYEQATGRYGRCDRSAEPGAVPFYCATCRLEFYGNRAAFRQHSLTVEHMLLRQYAPFELAATAASVSAGVYNTVPSTPRTLAHGCSYGWRSDAAPDPRTRAASAYVRRESAAASSTNARAGPYCDGF